MLEEKYVTKALKELNETEETRKKSLEQFKLWISRNDFLKNCRQDDKFLLQFLRTKKFNIEKSIDLFERYMLIKSSYPKWFDNNEADCERMWRLYDTGYAYPLMERDEEGRRIILIHAHRFDTAIYSFGDFLRLLTSIAQTLSEEEETQIAGVMVILDLSNITLSHLRIFSINNIINFVNIIRTRSVGRHKKMYMVDLPNYATVALEVAKKVLSEKLRNRIKLVKNMDDLKEDINMTLLPLEFGGNIPESVMIDEYRKVAAERSEKIREINDLVDWDRVALEGEEDSCTIT